MTVLRQAACVRFMRLHGIVQREAREVGAKGPSEHISYFILNIYSALTGVYSMEIVGGDEEFPWKEEGEASCRDQWWASSFR